ncbi:MAG: hypothetical protein QE487_15065 [Fluviicola sp.]|nr:hypothetical protein [Fluviicola sp.]
MKPQYSYSFTFKFMKLFQLLLVLFSVSTLIQCRNEQPQPNLESTINPTKPQAEFHPLDSEKPSTNPPRKATVVVKNPSDYSKAFIAGLRESTGFRKFNLEDSLLIVDNQDTILFPQSIKIGDELKFTGRKDELAIALTIKRINYTTVSYWIEMVEFGKANHDQKGTADLSSGFFLGSESIQDDDGGLYFVDEYSDDRSEACHFQIRIGTDEKRGNTLFVKIAKSCNGKIRNITMDNFPMLFEK